MQTHRRRPRRGNRASNRLTLPRWHPSPDGPQKVDPAVSVLFAAGLPMSSASALLDLTWDTTYTALDCLSAEELHLVHLEDRVRTKADGLRRRLGERGQIVKQRLEDWAPAHAGGFDAVLVDAPCSGSGTLRRHPDLSRRLSKAGLEKERHRQRILLTAAFGAVKPGGRLIYATCSVFHEENEDVVQAFASDVPAARPESVFGGALGEKLGRASSLRIGPGPDQDGPDGFFIAAFRKTS